MLPYDSWKIDSIFTVKTMNKPSLMVAPNGARKQKSDHPAVPVSISETAQTALDCFHAGADSLHLHIRDTNGAHSLDPAIYKEAISATTELAPDMAIQITTESAGIFNVTTQLHCLESTIPASASIAVRETARDTSQAANIYGFCAEAKITVQHILYDTNDVVLLREWLAKGWVPAQMTSVLFVLGKYQPMVRALPDDLQPYLDATDGMNLDWTVCAFGRHELACAKAALQMGGNIRIGFENNTLLPDGSPAKNNAQTVAMAAALIKDMTHE